MTKITALSSANMLAQCRLGGSIVAEAGKNPPELEGTVMSDTLTAILNEIDQMKTALRIEMLDDNPNQNTLLAIKNRLRSLDSAASSRIVLA